MPGPEGGPNHPGTGDAYRRETRPTTGTSGPPSATSGPPSRRRRETGAHPELLVAHRPNRMVDHRAKNPIQHGGNQANIRARLRLGNRPLLDFSAPLNALGPPPVAVAAVRAATESIDRYPEPNSPRLVERLAEFHGVPADRIMVGAGTTELINLIGQLLRDELGQRPRSPFERKRRHAHLVEPSYG